MTLYRDNRVGVCARNGTRIGRKDIWEEVDSENTHGLNGQQTHTLGTLRLQTVQTVRVEVVEKHLRSRMKQGERLASKHIAGADVGQVTIGKWTHKILIFLDAYVTISQVFPTVAVCTVIFETKQPRLRDVFRRK